MSRETRPATLVLHPHILRAIGRNYFAGLRAKGPEPSDRRRALPKSSARLRSGRYTTVRSAETALELHKVEPERGAFLLRLRNAPLTGR